MNFDHLKILKSVVELGSLKAAAETLHRTQPALSIALKKLEANAGFTIIDRSQYRLQLTPRGQTFYKQAQHVLSQIDQLSSLGDKLARGEEPQFTFCYELACPPELYIPTLNQAVARFSATEFHFSSGFRFSSIEKLSKGEADLGLGPWFHLFHSTGNFDTRLVGEFHLVLVAAPELLQNLPTLEMDELSKYPIVTTHKSSLPFDNESLSALKSASQQCKADDLESARRFILSGLGWGMLPMHYVNDDINHNRLCQLHTREFESEFKGEIRAFRRVDKAHGPVAESLWEAFENF